MSGLKWHHWRDTGFVKIMERGQKMPEKYQDAFPAPEGKAGGNSHVQGQPVPSLPVPKGHPPHIQHPLGPPEPKMHIWEGGAARLELRGDGG